MATMSNIPKEIQESIRDVLDRRVKLSIKRMVRHELKADKVENKVLAFSACRLFILTTKVPCKVDSSIHYLDIQALESRKPNQLSITVSDKTHVFRTLEADTDEINHMITHVGTSLKQIFPAFSLERLIKKVDVTPPERLRVMNDLMADIEEKDAGPCGGFSHMYACMCDYHLLPYREEVAWDVDTIYLSQDSKELCLKDFDHLDGRDLVPVISALEHNTWFTKLNVNNVKLVSDAYSEILKVVRKNTALEELHLSNTGIRVDFVQKLSVAMLSNTGSQLTKLDLSHNVLEDRGLLHLTGALVKMSKGLTYLDLTKTGLTGKGIAKLAEALSSSKAANTSLHTLILADNSLRGEESASQALYTFLAQPNVISHLDLSSTDVPLDGLCAALLRGCCQNLAHLNLANNSFTVKKTKDVIVPQAWKNFFASAYSLQWLNLSGNKLPPDSVKELLLGISSNENVTSLHLDLSCNELRTAGARYLESCISTNKNITSLDLSDNGLEQDLCSLLAWIQQNRGLTKLNLGRNFTGIKHKQMSNVQESVIQLIQDEESTLESLSLADSKLRGDLAPIINAIGSNTTLTEIDISGNHMGDFGARMLGKALQLNTKLRTIYWDHNGTTVPGFEDMAAALEKNYTLKKMPVPVSDTSAALKLHPERLEAAVQKIESLLQRNHSSRKFASDQAYRLQQGFLLSSTQQLVDRLVVQVQDTMNALRLGSVDSIQSDLDRASDLITDAEKSRQILPRLQEIAIKSQTAGNPVQLKLSAMAKELGDVVEKHLKATVEDMLKSTDSQCVTIVADKEFHNSLKEDCRKKSTVPANYTKLLLDGVETDVMNKFSECNLSVAAHVSDKVVDEVIENLSKSHKVLTNHLNVQKSTKRETTKSPKEAKNDVNVITITEEDKDPAKAESPGLANKRKSLYQMRKQRPQSVIDRKQGVSLGNENSAKSGIDDRTPAIPTLSEVDDLDTDRDEEMSKVITDAPSSGAVENIEFKRENVDPMAKSVISLSTDSLENVPESKPVERVHIESLDFVSEVESAPKLSHVNKARPKRTKTHAVTRPMTKPTNLVDDEALQTPNTNSFFENKSEPVPVTVNSSPVNASKTDENENEKTPTSSSKIKMKIKSPFSNKSKDKDKDKEKSEKGVSGKSSFTSGFTNFFSKKQSSGGAKAGKDSDKKSTEDTKPEKKSSFSEKMKSNGPVAKEKKVEAVSPSPEQTPVSPSQGDPEDADKTPPPYSGPKLPSGRGRLLMGGDLLAEMKQKRLSVKPEKAAEDTEEKKAKDVKDERFDNAETQKPAVIEHKFTKKSPDSKVVKPPQNEAAVVKQSPSDSKVSETKPVEKASVELKKTPPKMDPMTMSSTSISDIVVEAEPPKTPEKTSKELPVEQKPATVVLDTTNPSADMPKNTDAKQDSASSPSVLTESPKVAVPAAEISKPDTTSPAAASKPKVALQPPRRPTPRPRMNKPGAAVGEEESPTTSVAPSKRTSRPPPPLPGSKPKPPARPRLSKPDSDGSDKNVVVKSPVDNPLATTSPPVSNSSANLPSGIVYDSSTLRLSVKGKIQKLGLEKKLQEDATSEIPKPMSQSEPPKKASSEPREDTPVSNHTDSQDSRPVSMFAGAVTADTTDAETPANGMGDGNPSGQSDADKDEAKSPGPKQNETETASPGQTKGLLKRASLAEEEVIFI